MPQETRRGTPITVLQTVEVLQLQDFQVAHLQHRLLQSAHIGCLISIDRIPIKYSLANSYLNQSLETVPAIIVIDKPRCKQVTLSP